MKASEFKDLLVKALGQENGPEEVSRIIREAGVSYGFSDRFSDNILDKIYNPVSVRVREVEFVRNLTLAFYRIALTGVAAIVLLLISIFLMEGSLSFDSFIGLSDTYDESIFYLLTGN